MPKRPTLSDVTNIETAAPVLNANNDRIELAFDNTLSRDGSTPNQMEADLDLNSNDLLNAGTASFERIVLGGSEVMINDPGLTRNWATNPEDVQVDPENFPGEYSAFHYAERAEQAAADAVAAAGPAREFADLPDLLGTTQSFPLSTILATREEQYSYEVVPGDPDLTTAGGVMLQVLPKDGVFSIGAFNAQADVLIDNAPMITKAIERASNIPNGAVHIPAGVFNTRTWINPVVGTSAMGLAITGEGMDVSIIKGENGYYHSLMRLQRDDPFQRFTITGIGFLCDNDPSDPNQRPFGVRITSSIGINPDGTPQPGYGSGFGPNLIMRDCHIGGFDKVQFGKGRLENGLIVEYGRRPHIENVRVDTRSPWDVKEDFPLTYVSGKGIYIKDCYWGKVINCTTDGRWKFGVRVEGNLYRPPPAGHQDFEGFTMIGGEYVGWPEIGISIDHPGRDTHAGEDTLTLKEPGFFIHRVHFHAHFIGMDIQHHANVFIVDCNIATTNLNQDPVGRRANEKHIRLHDVHEAQINQCLFWGGGYDNGDDDCTRGIEIGSRVNHVGIDDCHFGHEGVGVHALDADTADIVIGQGNVWQARRSAAGGDITQIVSPRKTVLKANLNGIIIPTMGRPSVYTRQPSAKTFENGLGYWATEAAINDPDRVPASAVPGGEWAPFTHAMMLNNSAFDGDFIFDPLPNGATIKTVAVIKNILNPYPVSMGVQVKNAAGATSLYIGNVLSAFQSGSQVVTHTSTVPASALGWGWRPFIRMDGIGAASDAECYVAYFDAQVIL